MRGGHRDYRKQSIKFRGDMKIDVGGGSVVYVIDTVNHPRAIHNGRCQRI